MTTNSSGKADFYDCANNSTSKAGAGSACLNHINRINTIDTFDFDVCTDRTKPEAGAGSACLNHINRINTIDTFDFDVCTDRTKPKVGAGSACQKRVMEPSPVFIIILPYLQEYISFQLHCCSKQGMRHRDRTHGSLRSSHRRSAGIPHRNLHISHAMNMSLRSLPPAAR